MYSINITMTFLATLLFFTVAFGHMQMSDPPPFRSKFNKLVLAAAPGSVDYSMTAPIASGNAAPLCKGYQSDLGSPAGASVATWAQGSTQSYTVAGSAVHGGGSCQVSLSYDAGKTFTAIHSFIGSCPLSDGEAFPFTVPSDAPTGAAVFGWTWYNEVGNREIYMNCASITISAGSGTRAASSVAFSARPGIFLANLGNGCTSVEGTDIVFPNPGPDVTNTPKAGTGSGTGFTGTCGAVANSGNGASAAPAPVASTVASSPASSATSPPAISIVPVYSPTGAPSTFITSTQSGVFPTGTGSATQPISTGTTGGLTLSANGQCGGTQTCGTNCCSQYGYCGSSEDFCGTGCMAAFGRCGSAPVANGTISRRWARRY